jgi:hypothetical protein
MAANEIALANGCSETIMGFVVSMGYIMLGGLQIASLGIFSLAAFLMGHTFLQRQVVLHIPHFAK